MRRNHPSDISDGRWQFIQEILKDKTGGKPFGRDRKRTTELGDDVNAVDHLWNTGCAWRMLQHDLTIVGDGCFLLRSVKERCSNLEDPGDHPAEISLCENGSADRLCF